MRFANKIVLITGAAGNLGRAAEAVFAAEGAETILLDIKMEFLTSAYPGSMANRHLVAADLGNLESVTSALAQFPRIDIVCAIAGGFTMGEPVHGLSDAAWDQMLGINAISMLNTIRAVVPRMIEAKFGKIVTIGAASAQRGPAYMSAYAASKSIVMRLTESMAAELKDQGINVNGVLPVTLDTPQNRAAMPDFDPRKFVMPTSIAEVMAFLASPAARDLNGVLIPVTGIN